MPLKQEERQAAYDKWSPVLGEIFDDLDKDKSGFASVDEMCSHMIDTKQVELKSKALADFQFSMKHYLTHFNYAKEKSNELNRDEFMKFWSDVYALFDKFDKNGDGSIDLEEVAELLGDKADQFGLSKKDIHKQIQHFFNLMDVDMNQKISLLEFFIELPKVEAFLVEKKLGK